MKHFGCLSGPFKANVELFDKILEQHESQQESTFSPYICKLGINYVGNYNLDLYGQRQAIKVNNNNELEIQFLPKKQFIIVKEKDNEKNIEIQIGKTRMLELEDVKITSLRFAQDMNDSTYIHYIINI